MTDTNTVQAETPADTIFDIAVTKAKTTIKVNVTKLPDEVYQAALKEGVKVLVNSNTEMNKIKGETYPDESERKAKALEVANSRVEEMYANKLKLKADRAAAGPSGAVMTEARRLARGIVKDALRDKGLKVSHYSSSEITAAANDMLKDPQAGPGLLAQAEKNLAERGKVAVASIDTVVAGLKEDPKLVAKDEAAKAARKANKVPLSAKQAGMTESRATH